MDPQVTLREDGDPSQYRRLYKNHGDSIGFWEGWVDQSGQVILQHARTLEGKVTHRTYQAEGKNIGRANATTAVEQAFLELESRTKKQLDKGYVRTLDEAKAPATNALGLLKPMLATPLDKVKPEKITWDQAFVQPKLDGHRALFKDGVLYSRQGKELHLPHIVEAIEASGADHLHLDGELYLHGYSLHEISSLIKRQQPGTEHLEYHVYDVVADTPYLERVKPLMDVFLAGYPHPRLKAVETYLVDSMAAVMAYHTAFRASHYEGTMLRFGDEPYRDGKRSRTLLKIKEFQDAEFTIIGVEEGKPYTNHEGTFQLPIWICDAGNGETFTVTAQGDRYEKHSLWATREDHIGRQLTVKFHYLSADGIPQLPVALRFREDL